MSLTGAVSKTQALFANDTLQRVIKTVVEVIAAQAALYGTVVPNPPSLQASGAVAGGAGVLALLWNALLVYVGKRKAAQLTALANAIDTQVNLRFTAQAQVPPPNAPGNAA